MFEYPASTLVERPVPKSKFQVNRRPSARIRDLLTRQVREIRWHAKLAPETVNLPATPRAPDIQVFRLLLKDAEVHPDLIDYLDKALPRPLIFQIETEDGQIAHSIAYKRPAEAGADRWVVGARFASDFASRPDSFPPLPAAVDLERLYAAHFAPILPLAGRSGEALSSWIERCERHRTLRRKVDQLAAKVRREKQFNRRVELNRELNQWRSELERIEADDS